MPVYEVTDPDTGQTLELEGDSPPTEQELEQIFAAQGNQSMPEGSALDSVVEPAMSVVSGLKNTVEGGLMGIAQSLNPMAEEGAGAEAVADQQAQTFTPKTQSGQKGMETLNDLMQKGIDLANFPISGIGGLVELISGQGVDQAVETIKAIQESGLSKTAGDRVFDETGSPLIATAAETLPSAVGAVIGAKGAQNATSKVATAVDSAQPINAVAKVTEGIFQYQTPTKKRIAALIENKTGDVDTAKYVLNQGRAVKDNYAINAIDQGFDPAVIAAIKNASDSDKIKMQRMVDIMQRGKKNARYAVMNRPADIAGDSLVARVKFIQAANRKAGTDIDKAAQKLRGQPVDIADASASFSDALDSLGVQIKRNDKGDFIPDFSRSEIAPGDRGPLKEVIRQMSLKSQDGSVDALSVHKMKRIIDRNVTYGKSQRGLSGETERILKQFRNQLDSKLDEAFPEYNAANTNYAQTIGALDNIQAVAGRKLDFSSEIADKASGTLLRRLMSNTQSRANLIDSISELESVAKSVGGKFDDDLLNQALFADELDRVFSPVARTSFQGQIDQAVKRGVDYAASPDGGAMGLARDVAGATAKKVRDRKINEDKAFQSIMDVLRDKNFKPEQ
ncbi:MAG: hypothetical protein Tp185DCM00d2C31949971_28 [Prokaryotic dsDNA virus sp.]|uniref:hypothetical protein n=1 Tax=Gammaproteobacteria TaxID=1236 RepID=UPI000EDE6C81|nr:MULTISPECIES: hypothetical protein [Gammaproteobacteria]QDP60912.1 MAG: hypothetical protein Tp185DCM00d2C31949971_28 [Prokaryotic dsDNA virus sp.]QDP61818.1 MAG: hypothetical protein Tp1111MES1053591_57 [Prokaryotic dsDNA virus sp.]HCC80371.1 hypothetical protein [Methylophaga sp.]|tara:strand:+ start:22305 stop:24164 length:1860 start_codon:yes stop_codon:yes gene_type:complete